VAKIRKSGTIDFEKLTSIFNKTKANFTSDWLLPLEMYELVYQSHSPIETEVLDYLKQLQKNKKFQQLIANGIGLISK